MKNIIKLFFKLLQRNSSSIAVAQRHLPNSKKKLILTLFFFFLLGCDNTVNNKVLLKVDSVNQEISELKKEVKILQQRYSNSSLPLSEIFKKVSNSVVLIRAVTTKKEDVLATGFVIRKDGLCLSNFHVLRDAANAAIQTKSDKQYMISEIIKYDPDLDYVLFKIANSTQDLFEPVSISQTNSIPGEDCFTIGNPQGLIQTLSRGIISGMREGSILQTTTQITHGSSGGPLFNFRGDVIGITTKGFGEADLNFAIDINPVFKSIDANLHSDNLPIVDEDSAIKVLKNKISLYFDFIIHKDFESLSKLFYLKISRYYNKFNIMRQQIVNEHIHYSKFYPEVNAEIFFNTFKFNKDLDGDFTINLQLNWIIKKPTWPNAKSFHYDSYFTLNKDFLFTGIYSNIIKQH